MNQRVSRIEAVIFAAIAFVLLLMAASAHGAETAPKPIIATQNNYQAYAASIAAAHQAKADQCDSKVNALKVSSDKCKDDICRVLFGVLIDKACDQAQSGQTLIVQAPAEEKSTWEKVWDKTLDVVRVGFPIFDRVMSSRDRRSMQESSERQNVALYGTFGNMFTTSTGALKDTALGGFGALERGAAAAFAAQKDTYSINITNSSDLALFGGVINKKCEATSGNGGNGGNSAPGGQGGTNGSGGSNTAGAGAPSGSAPCTIAK